MHHLRPDHLHEARHCGSALLWLARYSGDLAVLLAEGQTPAEHSSARQMPGHPPHNCLSAGADALWARQG